MILSKKAIVIPVGERFGRLEVIGGPERKMRNGKPVGLMYPCRCDCGSECVVMGELLRRGTSSCGCYHKEVVSKTFRTHGDSKARLNGIYLGMIKRCENPRSSVYAYYGGKGVSVCQDWKASYENFRDWSLSRGYTDEMEIDRIDPSGHYCPGNCRWLDSKAHHSRLLNGKQYAAFGESKSLVAWCRDPRCLANLSALKCRLKRGWPTEQALTTPTRPTKSPRRSKPGSPQSEG